MADCRNDEERNPTSNKYIPKSRYDAISYYISNDQRNLNTYNDVEFNMDNEL